VRVRAAAAGSRGGLRGHMPLRECVEDFTDDLVTFAQSATTTKAGS
jgi:hypothetical protein